jgi:hypothetical protein
VPRPMRMAREETGPLKCSIIVIRCTRQLLVLEVLGGVVSSCRGGGGNQQA